MEIALNEDKLCTRIPIVEMKDQRIKSQQDAEHLRFETRKKFDNLDC